ncbi:MAG TPA: hypothetical protein VFK33_12455 [Bacillales bacterium]|nr:hypothetical protein [Bacillales bacterium]
MKRRLKHHGSYNSYRVPAWIIQLRDWFGPFCIPIGIFEGVRLLLFPTFFDGILFAALLSLYLLFYMGR